MKVPMFKLIDLKSSRFVGKHDLTKNVTVFQCHLIIYKLETSSNSESLLLELMLLL
jgi:hypothetical protein